jgi:hypothetical protein
MASVNQGITNTFVSAESNITPASPQTENVNGGAAATGHGWYGAPVFGNFQPGRDYSASIFSQQQNLPASAPGPALIYLMEANDSVTLTAYTWISVGSADWSGSGYPGPNSPINIAVAEVI